MLFQLKFYIVYCQNCKINTILQIQGPYWSLNYKSTYQQGGATCPGSEYIVVLPVEMENGHNVSPTVSPGVVAVDDSAEPTTTTTPSSLPSYINPNTSTASPASPMPSMSVTAQTTAPPSSPISRSISIWEFRDLEPEAACMTTSIPSIAFERSDGLVIDFVEKNPRMKNYIKRKNLTEFATEDKILDYLRFFRDNDILRPLNQG